MIFSNTEILRKIAEGDLAAYKSLFNTYFNDLVQYAEGYVFDIEVAKDVVQEVFIFSCNEKTETKESSQTDYRPALLRFDTSIKVKPLYKGESKLLL